MKIKIACVQINAGSDFNKNLKQSFKMAHEAVHHGAQVIAYPETFLHRGSAAKMKDVADKTERVIHKFQHMACMSRVPILLGSILEKSKKPNRYFTTSLMISDKGQVAARYRKLHLFDVNTPGRLHFHESEKIDPGASVESAVLFGIHFGFTICYDLRFPELYRKLAISGAQVIFVPSNFVHETGKAHWHALLRSRAIENQAYIVAPAQVGRNPATSVRSYGHSLIVDPWGKVLREGSESKSEVTVAEIDTGHVQKLRSQFPVLASTRFTINGPHS